MIVYAESSAVVAWLFRERRGRDVEDIMTTAAYVFASDLTLVECNRAIRRAEATGRLDEPATNAIVSKFTGATASWDVLRLLPPVVERARGHFPEEPIRSLDALHVAWALHAKAAYPELSILSLDDRIRRVGNALGVTLLPA